MPQGVKKESRGALSASNDLPGVCGLQPKGLGVHVYSKPGPGGPSLSGVLGENQVSPQPCLLPTSPSGPGANPRH